MHAIYYARLILHPCNELSELKKSDSRCFSDTADAIFFFAHLKMDLHLVFTERARVNHLT